MKNKKKLQTKTLDLRTVVLVAGVFSVTACQKQMTSAHLIKNGDSQESGVALAAEDQSLMLQGEFNREAYIKQGNDLRARIKKRLSGLEKERTRQQALVDELIVETAFGCFGSVKLKDVTISFEGKKHSEQRIANGGPKTSKANPQITSFMMGDDLAISNNENTNAIFNAIGEIKKNDLGSYKIADITSLRIVQAGAGFRNRRVCDGGGFFSSEDCEHENWETHIREVNKISIKVNGELLYEKDNINHVFREGNLSWDDPNFKTNSAYMALMARDDCPAD